MNVDKFLSSLLTSRKRRPDCRQANELAIDGRAVLANAVEQAKMYRSCFVHWQSSPNDCSRSW